MCSIQATKIYIKNLLTLSFGNYSVGVADVGLVAASTLGVGVEGEGVGVLLYFPILAPHHRDQTHQHTRH